MSQDNPQAIIQVRDLCNRFGAQAVHEHLDLDVRRGEILGVVGGSGTGKSVLLRQYRRPAAIRPPAACGCSAKTCCNCRRSAAPGRTALRRAVPAGRAVFLAYRGGERRPAADRERRPAARRRRAPGPRSSWPGWLPANAGDKYPASLSGGMIKRRPGPRPWRWTRHPVPRRAHRRPRPDRRGGFDNLIRTLRDTSA